MEDHQLAWILWYIWKKRNKKKVFSNLDIDPRDTLKLAETESLLWAEAEISVTLGTDQTQLREEAILLAIPGRWLFTDGSWKNQDKYLGQGWYSTLEGFYGLIRARNARATQSPLH